MFQFFQPYLYNNRHKFNFIHALKNFTTTTKVYFTRKTVKFKTSPIDSKRGELELHMTKKKRKKQCCELRFPQSRTHTQHYLFGFLFVICESNPQSLESIDLVLKSIVAIRKILQCMNEVEFMLTTIQSRVEILEHEVVIQIHLVEIRAFQNNPGPDPPKETNKIQSNSSQPDYYDNWRRIFIPRN